MVLIDLAMIGLGVLSLELPRLKKWKSNKKKEDDKLPKKCSSVRTTIEKGRKYNHICNKVHNPLCSSSFCEFHCGEFCNDNVCALFASNKDKYLTPGKLFP